MDSDPSSPTSPMNSGQRSRQASRCSSTTIGSSTTLNSMSTTDSLDLPHELDDGDQRRGSVDIAGVDKAFEDLDVGKGNGNDDELTGSLGKDGMVGKDGTNVNGLGEGNGDQNRLKGVDVDVAGQDNENENEEGSEETLNEDLGKGRDGDADKDQDEDEVDEDHPVYQYTLALFEYTKRQYMEARWQHEKLERDQSRRAGKQSGSEFTLRAESLRV
ncbi:hypothetical protein FFLO_03223 [Filobasidium floriforme]|uniref:Uncharacterized protein n=1 Tax=Filobasidium floriforme TaxID=5210 RepID=A0A8K0JMM6_9TREE|nr:hypothetical protein FFLO_03223 [Filobasidium floriforme]